jgi:hypothetical protein
LVGDASKTDAGGTIANEIATPPDVQAAATKVASDGGESVNKVHKKPVRANKRRRSK